jgi:hypothetical protein
LQAVESANDVVPAGLPGCASGCNEKSSFAEEKPALISDRSFTIMREACENGDASIVADGAQVQPSNKPPRPTLELPPFKVRRTFLAATVLQLGLIVMGERC